ncbi:MULTISPECIES: PDR/VanB family oxidoreductase [Xenophilus]|uniref:PDR/VanB family oxidoreductase n=1 Tax=Xenophilus TaxID=151754 RepID=UPI00056FB57F|nr:PDR/VanB family oxidoreductase [Xenophilus azovorans]
MSVARTADGETRRVLVRGMRLEACDVLSVELADPTGAPLPAWEPGAHIDVIIDGVGTAQYSLCGPLGAPTWRLGILHQPEGRGVSRYIHGALRPGASLDVRGPRNHFRLDPAGEYLFIAGGIGITPLLPMIAQARAQGARWRLFYGGRSRGSMAFVQELGDAGEGVHLFPVDERGFLPVADCLQSAPAAAVYCCGPQGLLEAVEEGCARAGRPAPRIERFSAPVAAQAAAQPFSVVLARSGRTLDVPADRSIADVLDEAGVFVPTSCREGICGSCETRVLDGAVDHRDGLLSEEERRSGQTMMVCVSRACGTRLTLDL